MRHTTRYFAAIATLAVAGSAYGATGARADTSGLLVWIFLGICALIVVAQVIPAVMMMVGAAKGVARAVKERREVPAESKVEAR